MIGVRGAWPGLVFIGRAFAQEPATERGPGAPPSAETVTADPGAFSVDSVLVSSFGHGDDVRDAELVVFERELATALRDEHLVIRMDEVPAYADYSASVYLNSCPEGRYEGCALVIGERAGVDYVVGGEVARDGDALSTRVVFIDVNDDEVMGELILRIGDGDDRDDIRQIHELLGAMVRGDLERVDVRLDPELADAARANADRRRIEVSGVELEDMENGLGEVERNETVAREDRLTRADLAAYDGREDRPPWERLGMTRFQYLRFRNMRVPTETFQRKMQGRQFELLIGTGVLVGQGPWTQHWEGWYGLDAADLTVVERATSLDLQRGLERTWQAEVGFGVLPYLDVNVFGGTKITDWTWRVQQLVEGDVEAADAPARKVVGTWFVGGKVGFAPLPTYPARPTLSVGAAYWMGTLQEKVVSVPAVLPLLERPTMVFVQMAPGFEVDVGRNLFLWGRVMIDVPVAGRRLQEDAQAGEVIITARPTPTLADDGVGVAGGLGVTGRIRLVQRKWRGR